MRPLPSAPPELEPPTQPVSIEPVGFSLQDAPRFSCDDFAGPLAYHELLLYECADRLLAQLRRHYAHYWWDRELRSHAVKSLLTWVDRSAAIITSLPTFGRPQVEVDWREFLVAERNQPPTIVRRLTERPEHGSSFHVVVETLDAVSIREVGIEAENESDPHSKLRLYLHDDEPVVAPFAQVDRRIGHYTLTLSASPRYWLRVDIARATPRVALPQEQIDWLFAEYAPRVLRWLWPNFLAAGRGTKLMMTALMGSDENALRDAIGIIYVRKDGTVLAYAYNRSILDDTLGGYERIPALLAQPAPAGWLPVLVQMRTWAGIRWLRICASANSEAPPPMIEGAVRGLAPNADARVSALM
jgi:hypothetical protein